MKTLIQTAFAVVIVCSSSCVRVHEYIAHGPLSVPAELEDVREIGVRATTTLSLGDPNSFGASSSPGATGLLIEMFGRNLSTTLTVANVRGSYSFSDGSDGSLHVHDVGRVSRSHYFITYVVPTGALRVADGRHPVHVLKYGDYGIRLEYTMAGVTHISTGVVTYGHSSHLQRIRIGWKD